MTTRRRGVHTAACTSGWKPAGWTLLAMCALPSTVLAASGSTRDAGQVASVLLIGNQAGVADSRHADCIPALKDLGDRFRARGDDVTELFDVSGPLLRAGIGQFAAALPPAGRTVVVFCGAAMSGGDKLFLLPSGVSPADPSDLPRQAVIARTVSRVLSGHDSIFVAELSTLVGQPPATPASIQSLREETATRTALSIGMAPDDGSAPLIERFTGQVAKAEDWSALSSLVATPVTKPAPITSAPAAAPKHEPTPAKAMPPTPKPAEAETSDQTTAVSKKPDPKPVDNTPPESKTVDTSTAAPAAAPAHRPMPPRHPRPDPTDPNSGSPIVRRAQVALLARGLLKGHVNGLADDNTQSAVKAYQTSLGHKPTGFLNFDEIGTLEHVGK